MDSSILSEIGLYTYAMSGSVYLGLAILLFLKWANTGPRNGLIIAMLVSVCWSLVHALSFLGETKFMVWLSLAETLRGAAWIIFLLFLMTRIWEMQSNQDVRHKVHLFFGLLFSVFLVLEIGQIVGYYGLIDVFWSRDILLYGRLIVCISVLLLVENLYRGSAQEHRWGIQYLCLGIGALYVYDFLLYADSILFTSIGPRLYEARGLINCLVVPLFAISALRNPRWKFNVQISRKLAFHTVTLVGSGAYLIGMSAAGFYIQDYAGQWGNLLQATFLFTAFVVLAVFLSSGKMRATIRVLLNKHFFRYKYDYREEWLRFIKTMSATEHHYDLQERVVQSLADIMDCSGGALWVKDQPDRFSFSSRWNYTGNTSGVISSTDGFVTFLEKEDWIVDLDEVEENKIQGTDYVIPEWILAEPDFWLLIPLLHHGRLEGIVILLRPRAKKNLDWESRDLLNTVGCQVASYLAEQKAEQALADTREFEAFNRKFAFVVHDIKNLTSQLSLLVKNAERHADNPEFQKDMMLTVQDSVKKMNSLLSKISVVQEPAKNKVQNQEGENIDLNGFVDALIAHYQKTGIHIQYTNKLNGALVSDGNLLNVHADQESLDTVFMHLVQNSVDASRTEDGEEQDPKIEIELSEEDGYAIVKIRDHGHGMSSDFIKNELFRPFRSTKENGYGIGAYESREIIRRLGGRMDVKSQVKKGTDISVYLRRADV